MDEKYTNIASSIEEAEHIEQDIMGNLHRKARKQWRKKYLEVLAESHGLDIRDMQQALENKHNGILPRSSTGSSCSYVIADILQAAMHPVNFTNHPDPKQLLANHKKVSAHYGYSYGRALEPSTLIQTQYAQSLELTSQFSEMSQSIQLFFRLISENFHQEDIQNILFHKAPGSVRASFNPSTRHTYCYTTRPDVILGADGKSLQITELEGAPGGHGIFASQEMAMYHESHLVTSTQAFLKGRPYRVVVNPDWVAYTFEQAAFCNMLQEQGVDAKVIITGTKARFQDDILNHRLYDYYGPTITDPLAHISSDTFRNTVTFKPNLSAKDTKDTVLFRFGYFNNFSHDQLAAMEHADTVTNSMLPYLESKNVLALAHSNRMQAIYQSYDLEQEYATLLSFITPSQLATTVDVPQIGSVIKLSGWDENAWGARSVHFGDDHTAASWKHQVEQFVNSDLPAVVQQAIVSHQFYLQYIKPDGKQLQMFGANTRLTPIIVDGKIGVIGSTFRTEKKVHSGTNSVMGIIR